MLSIQTETRILKLLGADEKVLKELADYAREKNLN